MMMQRVKTKESFNLCSIEDEGKLYQSSLREVAKNVVLFCWLTPGLIRCGVDEDVACSGQLYRKR